MNRLPFLTGCMRPFDEFGPAQATVHAIHADEEWMIAQYGLPCFGSYD